MRARLPFRFGFYVVDLPLAIFVIIYVGVYKAVSDVSARRTATCLRDGQRRVYETVNDVSTSRTR
jgi:hypothetical protein